MVMGPDFYAFLYFHGDYFLLHPQINFILTLAMRHPAPKIGGAGGEGMEAYQRKHLLKNKSN
jgi:hypothetical protein